MNNDKLKSIDLYKAFLTFTLSAILILLANLTYFVLNVDRRTTLIETNIVTRDEQARLNNAINIRIDNLSDKVDRQYTDKLDQRLIRVEELLQERK